MDDKRAVADARRFFRKEAYLSWGYLFRERKEQETEREKAIREACWAYWQGIGSAWRAYTKDNPVVKEAKEDLDKAIGKANELYFSEDSNYNPKLFFKAVLKAHEEHADKVASMWKGFMKDMKKFE